MKASIFSPENPQAFTNGHIYPWRFRTLLEGAFMSLGAGEG